MKPVYDKSTADELSKLYSLLESGVLTQAEFDQAKRRLLGIGPPGVVAQHPSVYAPAQALRNADPPRQPRAWWKVLLIVSAAFSLLLVAGALTGDGNGSSPDNPAPTSASGSAGSSNVRVAEEADSYLSGVAVLMGTANTEAPGEACWGVGDHDMFVEDAVVHVTAIGGAQEREGWLSTGTVDQYGHCRIVFVVPAIIVDKYQFGFDNEFFVHCDLDDIVGMDDGNYTTQVRVAPGGAYCQAPLS